MRSERRGGIGYCLTLLPRFAAPQALRIFADHQVTIFDGVPTMHAELLAQPDRAHYDPAALRPCVTGGAEMPVELLI